ncbi:SUMF1/EgtB/PvdO family nonheme iron enzyme, partial [Nocardioides sp. SOB44]
MGVDPGGTPDIHWCPVPGGEVAIEAEPRRKQVGSFQIARYPITAAQYRAFLEAEDGWRNPKWWADDLYREPDGDSYDVGRFGN